MLKTLCCVLETARFARFVRFGTVKPLETVEIVELCDDLRFFGTV